MGHVSLPRSGARGVQGDVTARGVQGDVTARAVQGDVTARGVQGDVTAVRHVQTQFGRCVPAGSDMED